LTVYLDGKVDLRGDLEPAVPPGANTVFIGGRCDNFANFEGRLDEVAFYDRPLTAEEVASHFRAGDLLAPTTASVNR
jgi:hypothetical protein